MAEKMHNSKDVLDVLRSVRDQYYKIEKLQNKVEKQRERAERGCGYSISAGHGDGIGEGVAALADEEQRLSNAIVKYKRTKSKAEKMISTIDDKRIRSIIYDRYCNMRPWTEIVRRYDMTRFEILHVEHIAARKIYRKILGKNNFNI